jgi:hypothetical protein
MRTISQRRTARRVPYAAILLALQFALLAAGALLARLRGWPELYNLLYIVSFLTLVFADFDEVGSPLFLLIGFFVIWLLTYPAIICAFALYGQFCEVHQTAPVCASFSACGIDSINYHFGESIQKMSLAAFVSDMDDLLEMVLNVIPYALAKGVVAAIGLNWLSILINIGIVFGFHTGAALVARDAL